MSSHLGSLLYRIMMKFIGSMFLECNLFSTQVKFGFILLCKDKNGHTFYALRIRRQTKQAYNKIQRMYKILQSLWAVTEVECWSVIFF